MAEEKAIILASGGLNSAVAASVAKNDYALALLHVRFERMAADKEEKLFEKQAQHFEAKLKTVVAMPHISDFGGNACVDRKLQIEGAAFGEDTCPGRVPGLIMTLLGVAFAWAESIGASRIFLGVSEDLGPPVPATRLFNPEFSREHVRMCAQAIESAAVENPVHIETPLMDLSRVEIVKLGHRLDTPFQLTWSCVASGREPCGECVGCATRNRGFLDSALPDPIVCQSVSV